MVCYHVIFLTNKVIFPGPKFLKSVGMFGPEASVHSFVNSFLEMFIFLPSVQNEIHFLVFRGGSRYMLQDIFRSAGTASALFPTSCCFSHCRAPNVEK